MEPKEAVIKVQKPATPAKKVVAGMLLPLKVLTLADVSRLSREIQGMIDFFAEAALNGATTKTIPQASQQLIALVNENKLNLLSEEDRVAMQHFIVSLQKNAPVIHLSFAVDPKPDLLMKLMGWFRHEVHPLVVFKVGIQPTIAAGCIIRTANKYYDMSFKQHFKNSKMKLATAMGEWT